MNFNESVLGALHYLTMTDAEFERRTKIRDLTETLEELRSSAKFNKEQWLENQAAGYPDTENRELKYKTARKRIKEISLELNNLIRKN
jgi:hypothetical protein